MKKKRFKHHKDLIKQAIKNISVLTSEEQLLKNILILKGMKNPNIKFIRKIIKKQEEEKVRLKDKKDA